MRPKTPIRILLAVFLVFGVGLRAHAQFSQRGSINGVVTDSSGAVIPGVPVALQDLDRNQNASVNTDQSGHYEFAQLLIGHYRVAVEIAGFNRSVSDALNVVSQSELRYDIHLRVGAATQSVEVTASSPLLDSDHPNLDQTISQHQVESLPINGRNFTSLVNLTAGVSTQPQTNINPGGTYSVGAMFASGGVQFTAGGVSEGSHDNGTYVNGVNVNDNYVSGISFEPSAEAIGEVKIGVADFSAEYGRDVTNFNASTKSGTNTFHGEVYDFIENDAFNAINPYDKVRVLPDKATKSAYRRHQYGAGLGGPVRIPKLLDLSSRAFFFANYERFPQSLAGGNNYAIVPSDAERAGNFGELCAAGFDTSGVCTDPAAQLYNPYTNANNANGFSRQPIPYNDLAGATRPDGTPLIDPASAGIANLYPHANTAKTLANGGQNFRYNSVQATDSYHWDSRFDYKISNSDNAFVTWSQYNGQANNSGGVFPQFLSNVNDKAYLLTVDEAHIFGPRLTNEFIFALGDGALITVDPNVQSFLNSASNPLNKLFQNTGSGGNRGVFAININGYATAGFNELFRAENQSIQFSDNVNWIHGRHSATFGFNSIRKSERDFDSIRFVDFGCTGLNCGNGRDVFTSSGSDVGQIGGDAFADVLLGKPKSIHQRYAYSGASPFAPEFNAVIPYYGMYANDKIQFTPRLTISVGLRYDLPVPIYDENKVSLGIYQPATDTVAIPGRASGVPQRYLATPKSDLAPRLGIAFQINPKLIVRAGYGLYYSSGSSQISNLVDVATAASPGSATGDEITPTSLGANDQDPVTSLSQIFQSPPQIALGTYPVSTGPGQGYFGDGQFTTLYYSDKDSIKTPYYHRYIADVQQQISKSSVLTLSYIGALGRRGWYYQDINVPAYRSGWADQNTFDAARPHNSGRFGDIYLQRAGLNSNYNAGIVKFERQLTSGLQILSHYTFAKTISDRGLNGQFTSLGFNYAQSVIRYRGEATASHRHRFLLQTNYEPKYERHLPVYLRPALGDWHISAIATFESGDALTVTDQNNTAQDYAGPGQPNMIRDPNLQRSKKTFAQYFDVSAFAEPTPGLRGNAGPGTVRGPGQENWDISFGKNITFYDRLHAEVRADMFNAFNHTQWTGVDTTLNDTTSGNQFGQITGGREARIIQLGAKIMF